MFFPLWYNGDTKPEEGLLTMKYLHLILIIPAVLLLFGSIAAAGTLSDTACTVMRYTGYALLVVALYLSARQRQR